MQRDRRDTEAQEQVPSLEGGEFRGKIIFLLLQWNLGPALILYTDTEEGMKQLVKREKKELNLLQ